MNDVTAALTFAYDEEKMVAGIHAYKLERRQKAAKVLPIEPPAVARQQAEIDLLEHIETLTQASSNIHDQALDVFTNLHNAQEQYRALIGKAPQARGSGVVHASRVVQDTSRIFGVPVEHLRGRCNAPSVVRARQAAIHVIREHGVHASLPAIGRVLNKHHTTILHSLRTFPQRVATDPAFVRQLELLLDACLGVRRAAAPLAARRPS